MGAFVYQPGSEDRGIELPVERWPRSGVGCRLQATGLGRPWNAQIKASKETREGRSNPLIGNGRRRCIRRSPVRPHQRIGSPVPVQRRISLKPPV